MAAQHELSFPRLAHNFDSPSERPTLGSRCLPSVRTVLQAVFYSVQAHQAASTQYHVAHGLIGPDAILVPNIEAAADSSHEARDFLHEIIRNQLPQDPRFQSVNVLQSASAPLALGEDYSDELESYFWALLYTASLTAAAKSTGDSSNYNCDLLWVEDPLSNDAMQAKMRTLFNSDALLACPWWSQVDFTLSRVLPELQTTLKRRYLSRIALKRPRTWNELLEDLKHDYAQILRILKAGIAQIDTNDGGRMDLVGLRKSRSDMHVADRRLHSDYHSENGDIDDLDLDGCDGLDEVTYHAYHVTRFTFAKIIQIQN